MIFPADAIDDLWTLPADEFRQKYSGINVTGLGPSDEGWYVRYRHENLTYLFGPLAEREDARKRKWDMETVRDAAIRNRASLASSQVDFVRFTFTNVYGRGGDGGGGGESASALGRISADGKSGPDGDLDGDGNSIVSLYVLAGVAASDAICGARLGEYAQGENHADALAVLKRADPTLVASLQRLLSRKTEWAYGGAGVSASRIESARTAATRLVEAARRSTRA